jgi:hypothetical protein
VQLLFKKRNFRQEASTSFSVINVWMETVEAHETAVAGNEAVQNCDGGSRQSVSGSEIGMVRCAAWD